MARNVVKDVKSSSTKRKAQAWAIEKPKLGNARKLRGIYFIDPGDAEFKETIEKGAEKVRKINGSSYALQDQEQEQKKKGSFGRHRDKEQQSMLLH